MKASISSCPGDDQLSLFLLETESSDSLNLSAHIQSCETCQGRLDELTVADDLSISVSELPQYLNALLSSPPDCSELDRAEIADGPLPELPGFELLDTLGHGGMGVVYRAKQTSLNREVAIKVIAAGLHASHSSRERLHREGRLVARLQHPNFVRVFDLGEHDKLPYLVLEIVEGGNLSERKSEFSDPNNAARLISVLATALETAHAQGIVHRDLKPANILLACVIDGSPHDDATTIDIGTERFIPKIADFGLSKEILAGGDKSLSGAMLGTPGYMSPEQATENPDSIGPSTDIHALGIVLYELLCGCRPFEGAGALDVLERVRSAVPVAPRDINPAIPAKLEAICLKCLRKDPRHRFESMAQLADDLNAFMDGRRLKYAEPVRRRTWKKWQLATWLLVPMLLLAAGLITVWTNRGTIVIQTNDPNVAVTILRNDRKVQNFELQASETTRSVFAGNIEIRLATSPDDQYRLLNSKFALKRGQKEIVTIERVIDETSNPNERVPLTSSEPRAVADWIVRYAGVVGLAGEKKGLIDDSNALPAGDIELSDFRTRRMNVIEDADLRFMFQLKTWTSFNFAYQKNVQGENFSLLNGLPQLRQLIMYSCPVTDVNFEKFNNYRNLRRLGIARTRISSRVMSKLAECNELEWLILSDKQLVSPDTQAVFRSLKNLRTLDIYEGTDRGLEYVRALPAIRRLHVYQSELITQRGLQTIAACKSIARLNFHDTSLAGLDLSVLTTMPALDRLEFERCDVLPEVVCELAAAMPTCDVLRSGERNVAKWVEEIGGGIRTRNLGRRKTIRPMGYKDLAIEIIELPSGCVVSDDDLRRFNELQYLQELSITDSAISGRGLENISHLKALHRVVLRGSTVQDDAMQWLAMLPALETLDLSETKVTNAGLAELADHETLKHLSISRRQLLGADKPVIAGFEHVRTLSITGADHGLLKSIVGLQLTNLTLAQSYGVTDASSAQLSRLGDLKTLDISETNITGQAIDDLQRLSNLQLLVLPPTLSTAAGNRIHQALPNCEVRLRKKSG